MIIEAQLVTCMFVNISKKKMIVQQEEATWITGNPKIFG